MSEPIRGLGAAIPDGIGLVLRRKVEAEGKGLDPDMVERDKRETQRLVSMLEVAFLAAAADGELAHAEIETLSGNLASWLGGGVDHATINAVTRGFAAMLEEQGFEGRLTALADDLDPASRRIAFTLAACTVVADMEVKDEEMGILGEIADAFGIPEDEAQAKFDEIFDQVQRASIGG